MLSRQAILALLTALVLVVIASLGFIAAQSYSARAAQGPLTTGTLCGNTAVISDVTVTNVTSMTAVISWQTSTTTASYLDLDSAIHSVFTISQPISHTLQGMAYAPGEYGAYLNWVDRDLVTDTIVSDVEAIASANFNSIVLYPAGPSDGAIHPWDQITLNAAVTQGLKTAFRLEWYDPPSFDWEREDCDAILDHYNAYLAHFRANPDLLFYFLINMPLDDPAILDTNPTIGQQRNYIAYCYNALKARVPGATVYANTYYGWRDELHQAPVGDLVDGVSVVIYAQHADGAPFNCNVIPTASHPASTLICKDQFDYYLDKAWVENNLAALDKPLVLDSTGFAPAASYDHPDQRNGIVADGWAKVRAIAVLRRYLGQDARLYGWSYFKLLHKDEAHWGLTDRRRITDPTVTTTHQLTLTDLFPATPYTFTVQAGDTTSGVYTFTTSAAPTETDVSPLITITSPPYGHELVPAGSQLVITWQDDDLDDDANIELCYDADDAGCDGTTIVDGLSEDSSTDVYTWTLPVTLPMGSYYIYGGITDGTNPIECDYSSGRFVPSTETLEIVPARGTITVDGVVDEPIWQRAIPLTYAIHISQTDVTTATVRALWDRDYLYIGFEVEDSQVETAGSDWNDDSVSIVFNNGEFKCRQDVGDTGEGECNRVLHLPPCTTLNNPSDADCGYTVEMRIQWSKARITANAGDVIPTDFLSVDHDGNPGAPYDDPGTEFSKLSWDGDGGVDTTGRSITLASSDLQTGTVLVDDFAPQPRQGEQFWTHNRLGGDRGRIDGPGSASVDWGSGAVTATITGGMNTWIGVWTSLNHPIRDCTPLDFSSFLPSQIKPQYQGRITGLRVHVLDGQGTFQVELQHGENTSCPPQITKWKSEDVTLSGGQQDLQFVLPITLTEIQSLNWQVIGDPGDFVVVDQVELAVELPQLDTAEQAFLWSYSMLLSNWDPASGLTRDHAYWGASGFDNVSASGMQAAAAVMAWRLGFISEASATQIVTKTTQALLALSPDECGGNLWPHFVENGQIISGTEWSSIDTVIASVALVEARAALGLETVEVEAVLTGIDWEALILDDEHISHGYWSDCRPIEPGGEGGWKDFGTESWLVNLGYAAAAGNAADFDHTPPTYNGSGFIDELAWLLVPPCCRDQWETEWCNYRQQAADCQLAYYQCQAAEAAGCQYCRDHQCYGQPGLFGLSAAEVPDLSTVPITQTYQAFGVGGEIPPTDGTDLLGHAVIVPHYAGMIASLRPTQAITFWNWIETKALFTPLNNVESSMFVDEPTCEQVVWNALKGSWNLSLQTLGWGRLLAGDDNPLYQGMWTNDMLRQGYMVMCQPSANALDVVINEVAWGGTAASSSDEWIELYNTTAATVTLDEWHLVDDDYLDIALSGEVHPYSYYLIERTDDNTVSDVPADWFGSFGSGGLSNPGEVLTLTDNLDNVIDTANAENGGSWPAGAGSPNYYSMERINPTAADTDANWCTNDGLTRNGHDANNDPINGTPKAQNSCYGIPGLSLAKLGPSVATAGFTLTCRLLISNTGSLAATGIVVTDALPAGLAFVTQTSYLTFTQPASNTLRWEVGDLPTGTFRLITLTLRTADALSGTVTNVATATEQTGRTETASWTAPVLPYVRLYALEPVNYGGSGEAAALINRSPHTVSLDGWQLNDDPGTGGVSFPITATIGPGQILWLAQDADGFYPVWGFDADWAAQATTRPVPHLDGPWPGFTDDGEAAYLLDTSDHLMDALAYGTGAASHGWSGSAVPYPYSGYGGGQVLYRKLDQATGLPVLDTDTIVDWAQDPNDPINGRKLRYPGWDLERYFFTTRFTETATITYTVAPDNIYDAVLAEINRATSSIYYEGYTLTNADLVDAMVSRLQANPGMTVTVLLEGGPVGGINDQEKWACQQIESTGGQCWFMYTDDTTDVHNRYRFQHGKWMIIDEAMLLTGSENMTYSSMPADDKSDGTLGNRGVWLITDSPTGVAHALDVFQHDLDPDHHEDLFRWTAADPTYGAPPPGFVPDYSSGGTSYQVQFPAPLSISGTLAFEIVQSPENSLRDRDSLIGMVARAGDGDVVLVEQLYEYKYWGPTDSNPDADPNPRLEAYIAAARHNAQVRILLDSVYDDPGDVRGNTATCNYVNDLAAAEGLDLACRLGNPTGTGIHNKMVLVLADGQGYVHTGSINGSENSSKNNREFAVQVQSGAAYRYLARVFWYDWRNFVYFPLVMRGHSSPSGSPDVHVTYIEYNPPGDDVAGEYVVIQNQGGLSQVMTGWTLSDEAGHTYTFPTFTLQSGATVRVWTKSGSDTSIDLYWGRGAAVWTNTGDCAYLQDSVGTLIDTYCY